MKRRNDQRKPGESESSEDRPGARGAEGARREPGKARKTLFRVAALLTPLGVLLLVEGALRLLGVGYATGYFLKDEVRGRPVYVANMDFTRRFFPPGMARTPLPLVLPAEKPRDTTRIFVFGESAAMGDPAPAFGFSRVLEALLRGRFPGRRFEVANVATTAINSHVLREIARDCARREGDIWILYIGNNEVVGPYGAGTVFSDATPSLGVIRAQLAFKATRVGQLLEAGRQRLGSGGKPPAVWEGMEMFLDKQILLNDPGLGRVYDHYQRNLEEIARMGIQSGARVLASTVVCNLKDCAPFASAPTEPWTADRHERWNALYQEASRLQEEGNVGEALGVFELANRVESSMAIVHFRMGQCLLALEDFVEARLAFDRARNFDTLRFRVDHRLNNLARQMALKFNRDQLRLVDAAEIFAKQFPERVPGGEFFYEHVHFNWEGHYLMARLLAEEIANWLMETPGGASLSLGAWSTPNECAQDLALTDWNRAAILEEVTKRLEQHPFVDQLGHETRADAYAEALAEVRRRLGPETIPAAVTTYRQALARRPEDWVLRENYGTLLEEWNDLEGALAEWRWLVENVPGHFQAHYHLANTLDKMGRSQEAAGHFQEAMRLRPEMHEARNGLALALDALGRTNEAVQLLENTLELRADFAEARVNYGRLLARQGRTNDALEAYQTAIHYRSNSVAARLNMGQLLVRMGRLPEAEAQFRAGVESSPRNVLLRFSLGNLLLDRNDPEAITHYRVALEQDPTFLDARIHLGLALADDGRSGEAVDELTQAVRLKPDSPEAHLNLGVALARVQRFEESVEHFRETLRLRPGQPEAERFLRQALDRLGK